MPKRILLAPAVALVARIASRSEILPSVPGFAMRFATEVVMPSVVSAVVVTTSSPTARMAALNSEVSVAVVSVAVAVTNSPAVKPVARVTAMVA